MVGTLEMGNRGWAMEIEMVVVIKRRVDLTIATRFEMGMEMGMEMEVEVVIIGSLQVLSGSRPRFSSTHRVAVEKTDTLSYIQSRVNDVMKMDVDMEMGMDLEMGNGFDVEPDVLKLSGEQLLQEQQLLGMQWNGDGLDGKTYRTGDGDVDGHRDGDGDGDGDGNIIIFR